MPTAIQDCANYKINIQMCPCTYDCANHAVCCECLRNHVEAGSLTACMRDAKRALGTLDLVKQAVVACATNQARNLEACACTYEPCERKGVCCNCVRNHWTPDGSGRVACMR